MQYNNIKILVVILVACIGYPSLLNAQIEINAGDTEPYTPINIIENVFLGSGLEIIDIDYDGFDEAVGVFSNGSQYIGLEQGIVLSTGLAEKAAEVNDENTNANDPTTNTSITDSDLQGIAADGSVIKDIARYEITFEPESDTIRFRYVFASEEYPAFVCSDFNDVFGFFISGPNPSGGDYDALNIARVPDPSDPSGTTFMNNNVAINSVNSGELGTLGGIDSINCSGAQGSLNFSQYYNEVSDGDFPVFNAYLDVFIAQAIVVPCSTYTIKIAIGDVKDQDFDSAVFLEAASFYSPALSVAVNTESPDGAIAEGCSPAEIEVSIPFALSTDTKVKLAPLNEGQFPDQARNNDDYNFPTDDIIIAAGSTSTTIILDAIEDGNNETDEFIYLEFERSVCRTDTVKIKIKDNNLQIPILPADTTICELDIIRINPEFEPELEILEPEVFSSSNSVVIGESDELYSSNIQVQGVPVEILNRNIFAKICIDTLVTRNLTDIELFVVPPQGQIFELSTNNGLRNKPASCNANPYGPTCIDSLKNTCFTIDASQNINNGNAVIGSVFGGNNVYDGEYLPEGNWDDIFNGESSLNGVWQLLVKSDSVSVQDITNQNSYLESWSIHFESAYTVEPRWSPNFNLVCNDCFFTAAAPTDDVTYRFEITDSYGCETEDDIRITVLEITDMPLFEPECIQLSPSSVQVSWTDVGADVEYYSVNQGSSSEFFETTETTFIFEGLESGTEHTFFVSAFNGECNTALDSTLCQTPPCPGLGPEFGMVTSSPPSCIGRNDGQVFAQASSSSAGELTYYIENIQNNTGEFNFLPAGDYQIRVVDESGCSTVQPIVVPAAQDVQYEVLGEGISCVGEGDAEAIITIIDEVSPPYEITWQNGSEDFTQSDLDMGTYFFTITDGGGCNYEKNIMIDDPAPLEFDNINAQLPDCFGDEGNIELTMEGGTGAYNYNWEDTAVNTPSVSFVPGIYSVTVSDVNDCSVSADIEIEERLEIILGFTSLQAACIGELSQEIELEIEGGAPEFTVEWDGVIEGVEVEQVPVGLYELTITDSKNCFIIESFEVMNFPDLDLSFDIREPDCFNVADGIISIAPSFYTDGTFLNQRDIIWETGSTDEAIGNLAGGEDYSFTLTDDFGCKHIDSVFLSNPPAILANVDTIKLLDCFGDEDGSFSVNPTGGAGILSIEWSTNIPTLEGNTASDLGVGVYSATITDEDFCVLIVDFEMTQPDQLVYGPDVNDVDCFDEANGEIVGEIEGGVGPYVVEWSTGSNLDSLMGLQDGFYDVTITDANDCSIEENYEITQPSEPLTVTYEVIPPACFGESSASIIVSVSGGTLDYNILLDSLNNFNNQIISDLSSGVYDLTVIDGNGCTVNISDIFVPDAPEIFVTLPLDTVVEFGSSLKLAFMTNSDILESFSWIVSSPEVELSCDDCECPIIESVETDFFVTLTARDSTCKYTTNQYFIREDDNSFVDVPSGFSPNGDNRNDKLWVFGKPNVDVMNFEVFDRWGELLFSQSNFVINEDGNSGAIAWDGTFNGTEMDSGVYAWRIKIKKLNGDIKFQEGSTTIIR